MDKELIERIQKVFEHDDKFEKFPNFITDIHFPCFKGLVRDSVISFQFPLTVLVGENGCGKSSVLQALETAPEGKSYTQRWFSTSVDPIPDNPRPAFWYSYNSVEANQNVQILNQRIKHDKNPDYWEPSRPVVKYGMDKFEESENPVPGAKKTRWNGTKRSVLYLDFRGELSAFDKYFYFGNRPNTETMKTKQDYIRRYSVYLTYALKGIVNDLSTLYGKKYLKEIKVLTNDEVKEISNILDKPYSEIKIIPHRLYQQWGDSVYFKLQNAHTDTFKGEYTEAFAGSGESAVAKLIHNVYSAEKGTLVLLDEPEVSLHPGAQKGLLHFLLEQTLKKGLQIILTTHSPAIVEELPAEAIVLLHQNPEGTFSPKGNISSELAFQYIGHINTSKPKILVEDAAAKNLLVACLRLIDEKAVDSVDVVYHAGGAKDLYKEAVMLARLGEKNVYLMLDGDQQKDIPNEAQIAAVDLDSTIEEITGIKSQNLGFVADGGKVSEQQEQEKRNYLSYLKSHLFFFPTNDPEEIMWEASSYNKPDFSDSDYKDRIRNWAVDEVGDDCKASDIENLQKRLCRKLDREQEYVKTIMSILQTVLAKEASQ